MAEQTVCQIVSCHTYRTVGMNILFVCTFKVTENASGGIARVTGNLSKLFTEKGHVCNLAYYNDVDGPSGGSFGTVTGLVRNQEKEALSTLAARNDVFIVQVQMSKSNLYLLPILKSVREQYGTRIIYCHHSVPFAEAAGYDSGYLKYLLFHSGLTVSRRISQSLWCLTAMLFPQLAVKRIARRSQAVTDNVDMTVLLSESFIPLYRKYVDCRESQVTAIGNCVTFNHRLPVEKLQSKQKTLLVVSNMTEHAKRISAVLEIWNMVSADKTAKDWNLVLVGDGQDMEYYRRKAKRLGLERCRFEGRQDPLPYYSQSSILLMTSAFEGFGMVMIEAQQMGCVPVVFESTSSVHDIIDDGYNGLIVPGFDRKLFAIRLSCLMSDTDGLNRMARNCIGPDDRFSGESIYSKWESVLKPDTKTDK